VQPTTSTLEACGAVEIIAHAEARTIMTALNPAAAGIIYSQKGVLDWISVVATFSSALGTRAVINSFLQLRKQMLTEVPPTRGWRYLLDHFSDSAQPGVFSRCLAPVTAV